MNSIVMEKPPDAPATAPIVGTTETRKTEINPKLVKVLKKILEPKFKLHNDDYLNLLLTHLTKDQDTKLTPLEVEAHKQFLTIWLRGSVVQFERFKEAPTPNLLTFVLNITKYLCQSEQIFVTLNSEDILDRLIKIVKRVSQPNVTTTFIKLIAGFMDHKSGLQWIISTNYWELLIDIILNNETLYIPKEGNAFVAKLLGKSHSFNVTFCKNVIQYILTPLDDASAALAENTTDTQRALLKSTLRLLSDILVILLRPDATAKEQAVILILIETFHLDKRMKDTINVTNSLDLKGGLYKISIFLTLYDLKLKLVSNQKGCVHTRDVSLAIFDILYEAAKDLSVTCMLQLLFATLKCWSDIKASLPQSLRSNSTVISFEDQLMAIQLTPMFVIFVKTIGSNIYTSECDDSFRYMFISRVVDRIYPKTVRVNYKWQNYLLDNYSIGNGILALKYFIHSKKLYSKENAILCFQALVYLVKDLNTTLKEKPELQFQFVNEPDYLELHLSVIVMIIDEFKLIWQDTIESLCVLYIVYHLLNGMVWPTKIVVAALKLAATGISKYMTVQMALLMKDTEDSLMNELPRLLHTKLFDGAWEVRDSTVELLQTLFVTSNNTDLYSFKRLSVENDLPCSILRMATDDGNPFVRASALRCVQKGVEVEEFWKDVSGRSNIYATVLKILQVETEGIVRCEAATLADCIYKHRTIPENLMNDFCDAMSHAVVADLHWEVRVKALSFWKGIVDERLTQEGMIDGSFPSVTFSKQLKKIVTLSEVEVTKRLVKVLYELSEIGCLSVFYEALQDECDIEVSKVATETIKDFVELLKGHGVTLETTKIYAPVTPLETCGKVQIPVVDQDDIHDFPSLCTPQYLPISDSIMEEILDTRDLNLLETVFNTMDEPVFENVPMKNRKVLDPELFLNLVYTDLESKLDEKTKWADKIDNFQSLLDDILKDYEVTDVNSMDCY